VTTSHGTTSVDSQRYRNRISTRMTAFQTGLGGNRSIVLRWEPLYAFGVRGLLACGLRFRRVST